MKKINEILSHLKNNPEFRKINTSFLIIKFIDALPLKLKKGVKFGYVKNQTLYFVLTHPVYKMEFEYNKADIKSLLKNFKIANVEDIAFFVTNVIEKKEEKKKKNLYILSVLMEYLKIKRKMKKFLKNLKK
ncbi:MAG: DUF721 domain-containing protein [Aliarcobacter sp.]